MVDFLKIISMFREHLEATAKRSDLLKPLAWLIGILLFALAVLAYVKAPDWMLMWIAVAILALVALYGVAYVFCLIVDRDALRSESYSLNKYAITHQMIGDSSTGMFKSDGTDNTILISAQSPKSLPRPRHKASDKKLWNAAS